jgi:hypothetical protein
MTARGTRGAYRKEDRISLPPELQKELVEKAAVKYGNCQELAKHLNIPKSSVHYYLVGRLTMPVSVLDEMLKIADDEGLERKIRDKGITKDRTWANEHAISVYREMCRDRLRLPTRDELEKDDDLRRKAAAIISYILAEGSVWLQKEKWGECAVNITFAAHERDLYEHFRSLCRDVFQYDIGPPQKPGNGAAAIRGFIYSRFVAEWLMANGVLPGEKSSRDMHLPRWISSSPDTQTMIAALQPWCDGEGAIGLQESGNPTFSLVQARHSSLSFSDLPYTPAIDGPRRINRGDLLLLPLYGTTALQYLTALCRSTILHDVSCLFLKLGFNPRIRLSSVYLKDDGFWSCQWRLGIPSFETKRLLELNIVRQERKKKQIMIGAFKIQRFLY